MRRWRKILFRVLGGAFLLFIVIWIGFAVYVYTHKAEIISKITDHIDARINGRITITDINPVLFRTFPNLTLALKGVVLCDSADIGSGRDLLNAKDVFLSVNIFSLISGKPRVSRVIVSNGNIAIFTDSLGVSNLKRIIKNVQVPPGAAPVISRLSFESIRFTFENKTASKSFRFDVSDVDMKLQHNDTCWLIAANTKLLVNDFTFNTYRGSYLRNKHIKAVFNSTYNPTTEEATLRGDKIDIDRDKADVMAWFHMSRDPATFELSLRAESIPFENATALLSPDIAARLNVVVMKYPVAITAMLRGRMQFRDTPVVNINCEVRNNILFFPGATIENCSFAGAFTNRYNPGFGPDNANTFVSAHQFRGSWSGISLNADSITVLNLKKPELAVHVTATAPAQNLNNIFSHKKFLFTGGSVDADIKYRGGINDLSKPVFLIGAAHLVNAGVTYVPRNIPINNTNMTFLFSGNDLLVKDVKLQVDKSVIFMDGQMKNFANLYFQDPGQIEVNWRITSPRIYLDDFLAYWSAHPPVNTTATPSHATSNLSGIARQMDKLLDQANVNISLAVDKISYHKFMATNVAAEIALTRNQLELKRAIVHHAGGTLEMTALLQQRADSQRLNVKMNIHTVDISEFFRTWDNFGQRVLTSENLKGTLSAQAQLSASINAREQISPSSVHGIVLYDLQDASLLNFEPLKKIGRSIFRNRDMQNIRIRDVKSELDINGEMVTIKPTHIETSVLTLDVDGVYGFNGCTNINIAVPLRNPKKDELIIDDALRAARSEQGFVAHFIATGDSSGRLRIEWPLKDKITGILGDIKIGKDSKTLLQKVKGWLRKKSKRGQ